MSFKREHNLGISAFESLISHLHELRCAVCLADHYGEIVLLLVLDAKVFIFSKASSKALIKACTSASMPQNLRSSTCVLKMSTSLSSLCFM